MAGISNDNERVYRSGTQVWGSGEDHDHMTSLTFKSKPILRYFLYIEFWKLKDIFFEFFLSPKEEAVDERLAAIQTKIDGLQVVSTIKNMNSKI